MKKQKKFLGYAWGAAALAVSLMLAVMLLCGCGDDEKKTVAPATFKPVATPTAAPTQTQAEDVVAEFYDRGNLVGDTGKLAAGTILNPVAFNINDDAENTYEFLGWDADGDGVPEEFPYTLNTNTRFTAILKITPVVYHYDIYVRGELVTSKDCRYGDVIEYPSVSSSIEGEDVYIFLGWSFNGVFDSKIHQNITENYRIEAVFADSQVLKLKYAGGLYAKYLEAGQLIPDLSEWGVYPDSGYSIVWYTDSALTKKYTSSAMPEGNLTLYGRQEATGNTGYRVDNKSQLTQVMDSAFLSRTAKVNVLVTYDYGTLNDLTKFISDNCIDLFGYSLSVTTKDGDNIEFSITYPPHATVKSSKVLYTQLGSLNTTLKNSGRAANYDNFAVNKLTKTCVVNNSEALYYVLEQGMKPVIDANATNLRDLYETMKNVLRAYVSDDMSDTEKALAIYQYIILATTYDGELLEKVKANVNSDGNRSFCLEGVFFDNLAVCDGMSKAFTALCRMEGIECVRVIGKKVEGGTSHAWNKIKLGGVWYVVDVTSGGMIVGSEEVMSLKYFLMTDAENEKINKPDAGSYTDIKCNTKFDIYESLGYKMGSADEAAAYLKEFVKVAPAGKSSFEMELGYSITSDDSAVKEILDKMAQDISISYVGTGGIYCFVYER